MGLDYEMKSDYFCKKTNINIEIVYPQAKLAVCYIDNNEKVFNE